MNAVLCHDKRYGTRFILFLHILYVQMQHNKNTNSKKSFFFFSVWNIETQEVGYTYYEPVVLRVLYVTVGDACSVDSCKNGGTRLDSQNGYSCMCSPGFTLSNCQLSKTQYLIFHLNLRRHTNICLFKNIYLKTRKSREESETENIHQRVELLICETGGTPRVFTRFLQNVDVVAGNSNS